MLNGMRALQITLILITMVSPWFVFANEGEAVSSTKKTKVIYRKHSSVNFTEHTVQGELRAPEIFYIFQRKRAAGHSVTQTPKNFDEHRSETVSTLRSVLPQ